MKLYEDLREILDTSASEGVDVSVAEDMAVANDRDNEDGIRTAGKFLRKHYAVITKCRRMHDNETICVLCRLHADGAGDAFNALVAAIEDRDEA